MYFSEILKYCASLDRPHMSLQYVVIRGTVCGRKNDDVTGCRASTCRGNSTGARIRRRQLALFDDSCDRSDTRPVRSSARSWRNFEDGQSRYQAPEIDGCGRVQLIDHTQPLDRRNQDAIFPTCENQGQPELQASVPCVMLPRNVDRIGA